MESPKLPGAETHGHLWLAKMQSKLIELAYDAIFICDIQSRLLSWNQGAESLYGYSKQQALGQVVHLLLQTQFPQPLADIHHHLKSTGRWEGELDHVSRSGKLVRVESRWVFIANEQEYPAVFLEINRDITEREKLQRERIEAQAAEKAARETTQQMKTFLVSSAMNSERHSPASTQRSNSRSDSWDICWKNNEQHRRVRLNRASPCSTPSLIEQNTKSRGKTCSSTILSRSHE
jgi:PAS domain S-box